MALAKADPRFLAMNPQFAAQENANMARYGYVKGPDGKYREATAAENPYSPIVGWREGFKGDFANLQGNQAARGILFSGGNVSQSKGLAEGVERNIFKNQIDFNDADLAIGANRNNLINSIISDMLEHPEDYAQQPAAEPVAPAPPAGSSTAGVTSPLPAPPKTGITTQGPNMTLTGSKPKPKKKKAPKKGTQTMTSGGSSFGPGPKTVPS